LPRHARVINGIVFKCGALYIASFFKCARYYCIVFLNARAHIALFFSGAVTKFVIDVASFHDTPPISAHRCKFCDRALSDRPTPPADPETDRGGIPLLLRLGVLKKGSARLYAKKGYTLNIASFFNARANIASFFICARLILHRFLNGAR
jgi:hypothetical protein